MFIPRDCGEEITALGIELGVFERCARGQDARKAAANQFPGDRGFELIANGNFPSCGEQSVDVCGGGMVWEAGHRGLMAFGQSEAKDFSGHFRVIPKDLIEVAQSEKQDGPSRKFLTKLAVLPLHGGLFFHEEKGCPLAWCAQERTDFTPAPKAGSCSHELGGEFGEGAADTVEQTDIGGDAMAFHAFVGMN